jgi:hypothetical protein
MYLHVSQSMLYLCVFVLLDLGLCSSGVGGMWNGILHAFAHARHFQIVASGAAAFETKSLERNRTGLLLGTWIEPLKPNLLALAERTLLQCAASLHVLPVQGSNPSGCRKSNYIDRLPSKSSVAHARMHAHYNLNLRVHASCGESVRTVHWHFRLGASGFVSDAPPATCYC